MPQPPLLLIALTALTALCILAGAALRAWRGWLALRRLALERPAHAPPDSSGAARIVLADLRERIRRLEEIADGTRPDGDDASRRPC